jgi:hypothetical protein
MRGIILRVSRSATLVLPFCLSICVFAQNAGRPNLQSQRAARRHALTADGPVAISPGNWSQVAKFAESKVNSFGGYFGTSVAISGNTIVVTDPETLTPAEGFVFVEPANGWVNATPTAVLSVPNSGTGSSPFSGGAVAISGDTIVMGQYVYVKPSGGWKDMNPTATLSASDGTSLGSVVAISGDTIVESNPYANSYAGAGYVFVKPAGGWQNATETAVLSINAQGYDDLGWAAAISSNTIALDAFSSTADAVAVYEKPSSGWTNMTQSALLTGSDSPEALGTTLAMSGNEILAGALIPGAVSAAYLFVEPPGGWINATETAKLSGADPDRYADYGSAVAIDGKIAVVGAEFFSHSRFMEEGGVYIFTEPAAGWRNMSSATVINGSDSRHGTEFGGAVAVQGKTIVVGAPAFSFHSAYVFTTSN